MNHPQHSTPGFPAVLAALLVWFTPSLALSATGDPFGDFSETTIYEVGEIPFQNVWHGNTLKFRVRSEALGSAAIITATYVQPPTGEIHFANNGDFGYRPGTGDLHEFTVTFRAQSGTNVIRQTIPVSPQPRLPEEESYFGIERGPIPNAEDKEYLVFTEEFSKQTNVFNYFTNLTRHVVIAGKTVVLQQGNTNGFYEALHERWDLQKLEIHAEKLIIASPIRVPGTDVKIRARDLEFQDFGQASYLSTEPRTKDLRPADFAGGADGLPAGNLSLFIQSLSAPPGLALRIRLLGGNGESGGLGADGTPGHGAVPFSPTHWGPSLMNAATRDKVTLIHGNWDYPLFRTPLYDRYWVPPDNEISRSSAGQYVWKSGDGSDAAPGGQPGSGGIGGTLVFTKEEVEQLSSVRGGDPGLGSQNQGGEPGYPPTTYLARFRTDAGNHVVLHAVEGHTATAGNDAFSLPPNRSQPLDGDKVYTAQAYAWLSPLALREVIAHARNAYLHGQVEFVEETFSFYLQALDELDALRDTPFWVELSPGWELDFAQMADEMRLIRHRIASNLDYFGNPPGWVPLLSFEANKIAFEQDIDTSIRVLYLEYWLGNYASNITQRIAGQTTARDLQKAALEKARLEYQRATEVLPEVRVQAENMQVRIADLQAEIRLIEADLEQRAQGNVADRHKLSFWRSSAGFLGRICQVIPIYQPILGAIGQGLVLASEYNSDDPWATLSQVPEVAKQFTDENWEKSVAQTKEIVATLPTLNLDDATINDIPAIVKDFQEKAKPWKEHWNKMVEATRIPSAPKSEVEAELQKLRRESPELNEIIGKVESLMADKEALLLLISQTTQQLGRLSSEIQFGMLSINALNQDISQGLFAFDDRAVSYLHEMGRRARERLLRYHYYLKKAYEYRLLRPYTTDLDLTSLFNRFRTLAEEGGAQLNQANFQALAVIYSERLADITSEVIALYNANAPERSSAVFLQLTAEQLATLNTSNAVLTLNFKELGLFSPLEENLRIVNIEVFEMNAVTNGQVGTGYLDLLIEHSGESVVSKGGLDYRFRHYNRDTEQPLVWGARYTPAFDLLVADTPSDSADSLLRSLLGPGASSEAILLWSRPGALADFHIRRQVYAPPPANGDIRIESLVIRITYDYFRRGPAVAILDVMDESGVAPYVQLNKADQANRKDGRGSFRRAFATGENVALKFPVRLGNYKLSALKNAAGNSLPMNISGDTSQLNLILGQNTVVRARYDAVPSGARFNAFKPPTPGNPTATFSIEGEYFAPYRIEFTPTLPATNWSAVTNVIFVMPELLTVPAPPGSGFFRAVPNP